MLARRIAAMQHGSMTTLVLSKRGSVTLPPELRRKMGLDKLRNPMLLVEEREGGAVSAPRSSNAHARHPEGANQGVDGP